MDEFLHGTRDRSCIRPPGGNRPGAAPSRTADAVPGSLDQWSRPSRWGHAERARSPILMPSHSVRPAGKRHSHDEYVGGADAQTGRLPATDARDSGKALPGGHADCGGARSGKSAGHFPSVRASVRCSGTARHSGSTRRKLARPASRGERGHSRDGRPGRHDSPILVAVAPAWRPSGARRRPRAGPGPDRD